MKATLAALPKATSLHVSAKRSTFLRNHARQFPSVPDLPFERIEPRWAIMEGMTEKQEKLLREALRIIYSGTEPQPHTIDLDVRDKFIQAAASPGIREFAIQTVVDAIARKGNFA
jgi:hypothetical protein